ncbi:MAG: histidine kinase, partial [Oscillospiraceae bacterium]|nr:histidine kinase [Oscillospiraceae bacterium]
VCVFSLCYLLVNSEASPLKSSLLVSQAATFTWMLFALREQFSSTLSDLIINMRVSLMCVSFIAPLWLITILIYAERLKRKNYWLIPVILLVPSVLSAPMLSPASSDMFKLYIRSIQFDEIARVCYMAWGPFERYTAISAFCFTVLIFCFLLNFFIKNKMIKMAEKVAVLLILWLPILAHYSGLVVDLPFDIVPISFSLWGAITAYLSYHRQFFNAIPSQLWNIFSVTKECMAVIGLDGSVYVNKSFLAVFGFRDKDFFTFADELCPGLSEHINQMREIDNIETEIDGSHYEISTKRLYRRANKYMGQLLTINDVTETKQLTLATERARIASGLHDSMGNRLIASINNLNMALSLPVQEEALKYIDKAATCTVASLMMLRKIVEGLSPVDFGKTKLVTLIESVINRISAAGMCVDFHMEGDIEALPDGIKDFVYNACQEAMTNSVIHGKAENIVIKLVGVGGVLRLDIVDDGHGCAEVSKNNGLTAMECRASSLGGTIRFGSPSTGGFGIYAKIPIGAWQPPRGGLQAFKEGGRA